MEGYQKHETCLALLFRAGCICVRYIFIIYSPYFLQYANVYLTKRSVCCDDKGTNDDCYVHVAQHGPKQKTKNGKLSLRGLAH